MFQGKKTYLVAIGVILTTAGAFIGGDINLAEALNQGLMAFGLATLRLGMIKEK